MSNLSQELQSFIPVEYHIFLQSVPKEILDSLQQSIVHINKDEHPYLQALHALERTIAVYSNPARELLFMIGRISYYGAEYTLLQELFERFSHPDELVPFYARILIFQNKFDEALELCQNVEDKGRFRNVDPTTVFLYCELMLTRSYVPYFMGDFDTFDKRIEEISKYTTSYQLQKSLGNYMSDVSIYEQLLLMMKALRSGDPEGMKNVRIQVDRWIDSVNDTWIKGYFYNLSGISYIQNQEMEEGEKRLLNSMEHMEKVRDLRTYSAVGANLGTLLILEGRREDGRKCIEDIIEPFVILGNYPTAMTHMLFVSKQYLDSNEPEKSLEYLKWAESLTQRVEVMEPATFSHFCYLYSKFRRFNDAEDYLNKLKKRVINERTGKIKEDADTYTLVWYYLSQAYFSSAIGNIHEAESILSEGIKLADKSKLFDSSLELTFLQIQTKLRKFILTQDEPMILEAMDILNDLSPLIGSIDNRYFNVVIFLIEGYLQATQGNVDEIKRIKDQLVDESVQGMKGEVENYYNRMDVLFDPEGLKEENDIISKWMSKNQLTTYFVVESIRLLNDLQFQHFEIHEVEDIHPETVMIVQTNGITAYTHKFNEDTNIDEHLISALLMAMSSFSKEVLGEGMLRKIEQDKHILLMDLLNEENVIVLVVKKETYSIRKQFKILVDTLIELNIADYLEPGTLLNEGDPQFTIIDDLVQEIFGLIAEQSHDMNVSSEDEAATGSSDMNVSSEDETATGSSDDVFHEDKTATGSSDDVMDEAGREENSSDTEDENTGGSKYSHLRGYLLHEDEADGNKSSDHLGGLSSEDEEVLGTKVKDSGETTNQDNESSEKSDEERIKAGDGIVRDTPLTRTEEVYTGGTEINEKSSVKETPLTRNEEIYTGGEDDDEDIPTFMKLEKKEKE